MQYNHYSQYQGFSLLELKLSFSSSLSIEFLHLDYLNHLDYFLIIVT